MADEKHETHEIKSDAGSIFDRRQFFVKLGMGERRKA